MDLDPRATGLYAVPPEEFTAARNELAAELRAAGDTAGAAAVKALRKPTRSAWAVNALVRAEPELVEALLGAGGELRQAHRQAASGRGADQLRAAADAERTAVERLMARLPDAIGVPPGAALSEAVRNTLHAASSDDEARELVGTGTLTTDLKPVGLGPLPAGKARRAPPKADDGLAAERARLLRAALEAESALVREREAAARRLNKAEQALARAREAADAAASRARDARARLDAARTALAEAEAERARLQRESA